MYGADHSAPLPELLGVVDELNRRPGPVPGPAGHAGRLRPRRGRGRRPGAAALAGRAALERAGQHPDGRDSRPGSASRRPAPGPSGCWPATPSRCRPSTAPAGRRRSSTSAGGGWSSPPGTTRSPAAAPTRSPTTSRSGWPRPPSSGPGWPSGSRPRWPAGCPGGGGGAQPLAVPSRRAGRARPGRARRLGRGRPGAAGRVVGHPGGGPPPRARPRRDAARVPAGRAVPPHPWPRAVQPGGQRGHGRAGRRHPPARLRGRRPPRPAPPRHEPAAPGGRDGRGPAPDAQWEVRVVAPPRRRLLAVVPVPALGWTAVGRAGGLASPVAGRSPSTSRSGRRAADRAGSDGSTTGWSRSRWPATGPSACGLAGLCCVGSGGWSTVATPVTSTTTRRPRVTCWSPSPNGLPWPPWPWGRSGAVGRRADLQLAARPRCRRGGRSDGRAVVRTVTHVELRAGEPFVRLRVELDNPCRDHRLRLHVPLASPATSSWAEGQFAVVERGTSAEGGHGEVPLPTFPASGFVDAGGAAVLLDQVTEYELLTDPPELALTLLRSVGPDQPGRPPVPGRAGRAADPDPRRPVPRRRSRPAWPFSRTPARGTRTGSSPGWSASGTTC